MFKKNIAYFMFAFVMAHASIFANETQEIAPECDLTHITLFPVDIFAMNPDIAQMCEKNPESIKYLSENVACYGVRVNEDPVGYIVVEHLDEKNSRIQTLILTDQNNNSLPMFDIASALVFSVLEYTPGIEVLHVYVNADNEAALSFYKDLQFIPAAQQDNEAEIHLVCDTVALKTSLQ